MQKICVIGGANIDICGSSFEPLKDFDSNPGTIQLRYGGVARNIAQILALLKQNVQFVTCFSNDYFGQLLKKDCASLGIDYQLSMTIDGIPSSMYIAILDNNHDMRMGLSDVRILDALSKERVDLVLSRLTKDDFLVVDANLKEEMILYILKNAPCKTAADPVSVGKIHRFDNALSHLTVFKPNQYEASEMTGIWIKDEETARKNIDWFLEKGVKEIVISMAERGILVGSQQDKYWVKHRKIDLKNATGGGDTFMGAYLSCRLIHKSILESVHYGATASIIAIENDAVRQRTLNKETILAKINEMQITEKEL